MVKTASFLSLFQSVVVGSSIAWVKCRTSCFHHCKIGNFHENTCIVMFSYFCSKQIVGTCTCYSHLIKEDLTSTYNLDFRAKLSNIMITPVNPSLTLHEMGFNGGLNFYIECDEKEGRCSLTTRLVYFTFIDDMIN